MKHKNKNVFKGIQGHHSLKQAQAVRVFENKRLQSLTTISGDTILKKADYYSGTEFVDINEDGYKDIRVYGYSNTPNECYNYMFDTKKKAFLLIQDCDLDIRRIKGTKYYYSYNRIGLADMNWESYLSKIENYKLLPVGHIYGQGRDFDIENNSLRIEIFKITDPKSEKERLMEKISYAQHIPKPEDKWKFIKNYWKNYWHKFE